MNTIEEKLKMEGIALLKKAKTESEFKIMCQSLGGRVKVMASANYSDNEWYKHSSGRCASIWVDSIWISVHI